MWVNSRQDRQTLGYKCKRDFHASEQLSYFTTKFNKLMVKIGNKTFIFIIWQEKILVLFIIFGSRCRDLDTCSVSLPTNSIYHSCVHRSNNSKFLTQFYPPGTSGYIQNYVLNLRSGSESINQSNNNEVNSLMDDQQEKLIRSLLAKAHNHHSTSVSINKIGKQLLKFLDSLVTDPRTIRVIAELTKPHNFNIVPLANVM